MLLEGGVNHDLNRRYHECAGAGLYLRIGRFGAVSQLPDTEYRRYDHRRRVHSGCAVSATIAVAGHLCWRLPAAMLAGACAGFITAFLQTKLKIPSILAGIITNTGLYTVNLAVMGFSSNVSMVKADTMFSLVKPYLGSFYKLIPAAVLTVAVGILLTLFLKTRLGLSIRATGDNPDMVRASSINTAFTVTVGLCLSNAMTALSGAVLAQYQKTADINLGTGMVIIGLASLIIGETLMPRGKTWMKALGAILAPFSTASSSPLPCGSICPANA